MRKNTTNLLLQRKYLIETFALIYCAVYWWLAKDLPFFWDSIQLTSKQAHFYYEHHFSKFWLPTELDSGHPPFMGMYIAGWWKLMGRSLWVSHLALLPFIFFYIVFGFRWISQFTKDNITLGFGLLLLCLDPLFLAQISIMSPDVVLISMFVGALYAYQSDKKWILLGCCLLLGMISMRGAMALSGLGIFHIINTIWINRKGWVELLSRGWPMIPGAMIFIIFLIGHYLSVGWIGFSASSPWAQSFVSNDLTGFLKNSTIFIWRLLDYGRFVLVGVLMYVWYTHSKPNRIPFQKGLLFFTVLTGLFIVNTLIYKHLTAHRYFWPLLILISLGAVLAFDQMDKKRIKLVVAVGVIGLFLSAHLWKYPSTISQDWESTLIHLPYHRQLDKARKFMEQHNIKPSEVATAFPAINSRYHTHLHESDKSTFISSQNTDYEYVLWSSIMNDFKHKRKEFEDNWKPIWSDRSGRIKMVLYQQIH